MAVPTTFLVVQEESIRVTRTYSVHTGGERTFEEHSGGCKNATNEMRGNKHVIDICGLRDRETAGIGKNLLELGRTWGAMGCIKVFPVSQSPPHLFLPLNSHHPRIYDLSNPPIVLSIQNVESHRYRFGHNLLVSLLRVSYPIWIR